MSVPGKAFGEWIALHYETPEITPEDLHRKFINAPIMPQTSKAGTGTGPSFRLVTRQSTGRERVAVVSRPLLRRRPSEDRDIAAAVIVEVFDAPLA